MVTSPAAYINPPSGFRQFQGGGISPQDLSEQISTGSSNVIDLNRSRGYYEGHIPGAWYAIARGSMPTWSIAVSGSTCLHLSDGTLAAVAAADRSAADGSVMALEGGTDAWVAAGLPLETGASNMASAAEDIRLRAREQDGEIEAACAPIRSRSNWSTTWRRTTTIGST